MAKLNEKQLAQIAALLDEREKALRDDLQRDEDKNENFRDVASEAPDPGDASFASLEQDLENAAATRDAAELRSIDGARERIQNGTYGQCINCETEIPFERLLAQPTAERCAPCQDMYEKTHMDARRGATM
jgi:RNA polymerase-binding protein DksA